jgi:photosystem II stability/assembly factor-like uncharacterized protein
MLLGCAAGSGASSSGASADRTPARSAGVRFEEVAQTSGTTALLQAVSPVNDRVVWASGHAGTWVRTTDGGASWQVGRVPGADTLQFRDVHAVDSSTAYLMSAGPGELSRIFKTTDGGRSWRLQFTNPEPKAFYDCFAFWDARRGLAYSDGVDGRVVLLATEDGGAHWTPVPAAALPPALPDEGGFAASGTCLVVRPGGRGWIGTGNGPRARVLRTADYGRTWSVAETPVVAGSASGIATVAFRDDRHGVALGGQIGQPDGRSDNVAVTADGGRTWSLAGRPRLAGAVYGAAYVPGTGLLVAVSPEGIDHSADDGRTWTSLDTLAHWSIGFASPAAGWAVGPRGRITRLTLR